jgi:hypothetical protein
MRRTARVGLNGPGRCSDKSVISVTQALEDVMNFTAGLKLCGAVLILALSGSVLHAEGATADAAKDATKTATKAPVVDEFVTRVFGSTVDPAKKTYACFTRAYDPEHLAEHPQQKVSGMKLLLTAEQDTEEHEMNYSFRLGVKYRSKSGNYDSSGDCGHGKFVDVHSNEASFGCGVDCDGGGINILMTNADKSVMVKLERIRIWKNQNYDEDAAQDLVAGADDKSFRLDRTTLQDCESLVTDRKELAAMRHK